MDGGNGKTTAKTCTDNELWTALRKRAPFGKHIGKELAEILQDDPTYLPWLLEHATAGWLRDAIKIVVEENREAIEKARAESSWERKMQRR